MTTKVMLGIILILCGVVHIICGLLKIQYNKRMEKERNE